MQLVQLDSICNFEKGNVGLAKAVPGEYPLVTTGSERRTCDSYQFDTNAVCIPLVSSTGHGHASLKNVHYQDGKFALGSILVALTAKDENQLNIQYLHLYLSELKDQILVPLMSGAANVALSVSKIKQIKIPLPSISQQRQIVRKFNSIKQEDTEFRFELTKQLEMLRKLRQQILQDAVEGKLTVDWRFRNLVHKDARKDLALINEEKNRWIKDRKLKAQKSLPDISEDEMPFVLPDEWTICRLGSIGEINPRNHQNDDVTVGFTPMTLVNNEFGEDPVFEKRKWGEVKNGFTHFADGDLVIAKITPCFENAKSGIIRNYPNSTGAGTTELHVFRTYFSPDLVEFIYLIIKTDRFLENGRKLMSGAVGQKRVPKSYLEELIIPFPPLIEQRVIVSKVKELFLMCKQLESQIINNQFHAEQLMQAVLKDAFSQTEKLTDVNQVAVPAS